MPRFSVIVPAYQVQAYLHSCLESVLGQSYADLELIAVDDGSPDRCGAVIDEFAARDPRVRAVHLGRNTGLGPARNAGVRQATGDYLIFLDGDDVLTPHALRAIAERLERTGDPDVLVYDYARLHLDGTTVRNRLAAELREDGPVPFRLDDRPGLLDLLMVVWNKAYRRSFVEREGLRFPQGCYEDTPFTYPALLAAGSLATLDRVCLHYRQRRLGNILGTPGLQHFDVFAQYDRVFAFLDARPGLAHWRGPLFHRMTDHLFTVLNRGDRLPRGAHQEFLRRARAQYLRRRVPGRRPATWRERARHLVIRSGSTRLWRALRLVHVTSRLAARLARAAARTARALLLRLHFATQRLLPTRDLALFTAGGGTAAYGGDPGALETAFRVWAPRTRTAWAAPRALADTVPPETLRLTPGSRAWWTALARARYLVTDTGFGPPVRPRRGQVLLRTCDGLPLTRTGLDAARPDVPAVLADADSWDLCLSGDAHTTAVHERGFPGRYTTLEFGRPRTDAYQRATAEDVARARALLGLPHGRTAVLYAPARRSAPAPSLDVEELARRLGEGFVLLTTVPDPGTYPAGRVIDVSATAAPQTVLCLAADVLLTDCSPLIADFAALDRPVVAWGPDRAALDAVHGLYPVEVPGAVAEDEPALARLLATGACDGPALAGLRAAFRERHCPHDDGRVAERVVRRVVLGERSGLPAVTPPADRRPVPAAAPVAAHVPGPAALPAARSTAGYGLAEQR
ncbi:bifunctional glycosyltransferase/CDP-glycerol:glycerophosphate glycerophosphotransferase [Streptomyces chilikensis]|uniref:bifunctional glycosyltransferase/CDP-glycerol:glycerophosphate glycerophosphotransferase n=1 Tax=Streptomyces chilikensis TaxID=1194079 RepID=UPI001409D5B0|nr:CDP-glycerol glycerophosphotransferase family protein [Streptomyces chilikensis]